VVAIARHDDSLPQPGYSFSRRCRAPGCSW
jgi:hypothetical protein